MYKSGFSNRFNITFIIILSFVTRVGHSQRFSRYIIIIIIKCVHAHVYIPCYIDTGGEGSYLNFCMELPRELFHSKHFSNGIRWPIFLILSTRVRYKKKNTLISDREKQTIFRRFSTTIPFFFFLRKGKISKNSRNKRYRFSSPPLPVRQNRECVYFALTLHFSLSLFFFSSRIERHEPPYFPDDIYSIRDGRKGRREKGRWKFAGKEYRRTDREAASRVKAYRAETAVPVPPIARFVAPSSSSSLRRFSRFCSGT